MSQHDFNIANQTASNARADINNALAALATLSSGSTAPSTTYANMLWYDTNNNQLKMRAEADDAWISIAYLDQSSDAFRILDNTQVVTTSGTQTGLLGDQATSAWTTGTGTTESLVSPAKVKAAIEALASVDIGSGTAALTAGGIGTYCFAGGTNVVFGSTISGANLRPVSALYKVDEMGRQLGASNNPSLGSALSGTWRCMGESDQTWILDTNAGDPDTVGYGATLWLRIS